MKSTKAAPGSAPLEEAAISSREATSQRMALFTFKGSGSTNALLIDFPAVIAMLQKKLPTVLARDVRAAPHLLIRRVLMDCLTDCVVGFLKFGRPNARNVAPVDRPDTSVVQTASAESGYGPLMYDLAMSLVYPGYLMADRGSVSNAAFGVWQYYLTNRTGDVSRVKLKGIDTGKTELPDSDMSPYNDVDLELIKVDSELRDLAGYLEAFADDPRQVRAFKKKQEKLEARYAKLQSEKNLAMAKDPLAWKFKIKKPLGTARLSENGKRLHAEVTQAVKSMAPTIPSKLRGRVIADALSADSLQDIGDTFFDLKYSG